MEAQRTGIQRTTHKKPYDFEQINRTLLTCYIWILVIFERQTTVPSANTFATIYYGSMVLVSVGFFSSFLGLVNSKRMDKFSRFCALYSSMCLALVPVLRLKPTFEWNNLNLSYKSSFARLFQWMDERLSWLGILVENRIGLLLYTATIEVSLNVPHSDNAQPFSLGTLSLKYNIVRLLSLLLLVSDGIFGFMRRPYIGIGVAIILVLGAGIPWNLISNNTSPVTPVFGIFYSLMFLSLILKQTQRDWLSHLMAGLAHVWLILGVLGYSISGLPLEYAWTAVSVLFVFVLFAFCSGYAPERVD